MNTKSIVRPLAIAMTCLTLIGASEARAVTVPRPSVKAYTSCAKVTWSKVKNAKGYYVFRATSASWSRAKKVKATTTTYFNDTSAVPGVTYYYWVCPIVGRYYYYNKSMYRGGFRQITAPYCHATYNSYTSYIYVYWSSCYGAKGYYVYRGTSSSLSYAKRIKKTTSTYFYDTSASPGVKYYYWIMPIGKNGYYFYNASKYAYGMRKKTTTSSITVPQPYGYQSGSAAYIYFYPVTGGKKYYLYRSTSSSVHPKNGAKCIAYWTPSSSYSYYYYYDYSVSYGTTYYYWVDVVDSSGTEWLTRSKYKAIYMSY